MKYALIGCGRIAPNHIKAVKNNNLELVAVCDLIEENMETLLKSSCPEIERDVKKYTDYKKMILEHPDLELIAIATSSGSHAEIALYCIDRGINIIIEKPIALNMADANEIVRLSKEKGVVVSASHQNRFNMAIQKMRKALEAGKLGNISHGSVQVRWRRDKAYYDQAKWRGTWKDDGGCLMNQCIHGIDLLRWMLGDEVDTVYGVTTRLHHDYIECEDLGMAVVTFKNGAVATVEGTTNTYKRNLEETLCLFGDKGTIKIGGKATNIIDYWELEGDTSTNGDSEKVGDNISNVYGNGHTTLYEDVIDSIISNRKPYVDAIAGRNALELVLAIYKSASIGAPVKLPLDDCSTTDFVGMFE